MGPWTEPAAGLPSRWGGYRARYTVGLVAIVAGIACTMLTSTYSLWLLAIGPAVQAVGWLLLPGALWRRLAALVPCLFAGLVLLAGASFAGAFAVLLWGWLLVRHRPALCYLTLLLPTSASFLVKLVADDYSDNWVVLSVGTAVTVGSAWLARELAARRANSRNISSESGLLLD